MGILGGTGPAGRGLAVRLAAAGIDVVIGSRDAERATATASELLTSWPGLRGSIAGSANPGAAETAIVVVATPWDSAVATVSELRDTLADKVVVSMVNALLKQGREMLPLIPPRGSMAAHVQAALPDSKIAAAFHHLPASEMENLQSGLEADVLVCSDHVDASNTTCDLVNSMEGLRALEVGGLSQASAIESFTAVCITLNIRHRAHSTVRLAGL